MKKSRVLTMVLAVMLVAVVGVGATLAYLSSQTGTLTNAFEVGSGFVPGPDGSQALKLDEAEVTGEDREVTGNRTELGNTYENLLPGVTVTKDPTVYLTGGSIESYVFVQVKNADALTAKGFTINGWNEGWTKVSTPQGAYLDGVYLVKQADDRDTVDVSAETEGVHVNLGALFTSVTLDADEEALPTDIPELTISACAVQAEGFDTAAAALAEATFSNN